MDELREAVRILGLHIRVVDTSARGETSIDNCMAMAHSEKSATSNLAISFQPSAFSSREEHFLRVFKLTTDS